jgi:hypothetical protein
VPAAISTATSISISTSSETASCTAQLPSSASCKFSFEDYARMCRTAEEMNLHCIEPGCHLLRRQHLKSSTETTFKMPSRDNFPTFRDPHDKLLNDPFEFLQKLERALKLHSVPPKQYGSVLVSCINDRIQQEWVETNLLAVCPDWSDVKRKFQLKYTDARMKSALLLELDDCTQEHSEPVYQYTERFNSLVCRIASGLPIDTQSNIIVCERGFIPRIRQEISKYRASKTTEIQRPFEFRTLQELYESAKIIETGLQPIEGRHKPKRFSHEQDLSQPHPTAFDRTKRQRTWNAPPGPTTALSAALTPSAPPLRAAEHGGRTDSSQRTSFSSAVGGLTPIVPNPHHGSSTYGPPSEFRGHCFGCQRRGHRIRDCPSRANQPTASPGQ